MRNIRGTRLFWTFVETFLKGDLKSRTALRLVKDWIDFRNDEIYEDWELARKGEEIKKNPPLE